MLYDLWDVLVPNGIPQICVEEYHVQEGPVKRGWVARKHDCFLNQL